MLADGLLPGVTAGGELRVMPAGHAVHAVLASLPNRLPVKARSRSGLLSDLLAMSASPAGIHRVSRHDRWLKGRVLIVTHQCIGRL